MVGTPFLPRVTSIQRQPLLVQVLRRSPTTPVFTTWSGKAIIPNLYLRYLSPGLKSGPGVLDELR